MWIISCNRKTELGIVTGLDDIANFTPVAVESATGLVSVCIEGPEGWGIGVSTSDFHEDDLPQGYVTRSLKLNETASLCAAAGESLSVRIWFDGTEIRLATKEHFTLV